MLLEEAEHLANEELMSKQKNPAVAPIISEKDAVEIIELATMDIELLARAFNLIRDVTANPFTDSPREEESEVIIN
jgi:hypothetical protein